jgi:hypothetical protein
MPQVPPRLPNSSSGGTTPQHTIDPETWQKIIPLIRRALTDDQAALLKADLERVISKYLQLANAALSVPILDWRKDLFSELRRALRQVLRVLEKLQVGDQGDFYTAYIEHNLSHPKLDDCFLGKLAEFQDRMREAEEMVRALETACAAGRKMALAGWPTAGENMEHLGQGNCSDLGPIWPIGYPTE